ncbi:MAG TPA: hypothetical protein VGJ77_08615 [Gaiellaceae bacterium]|jgi:TolB protein
MNADGTAQHRMIANAGEPVWSQDGRRLAFASLRRGLVDVYVKDLDSGKTTRLTRGHADNARPSWSSDDRTIAFTTFRNGEPDVYVMNTDGSVARRLTRNRTGDDSASWSLDGRRQPLARR